jgi:hypothetical protein
MYIRGFQPGAHEYQNALLIMASALKKGLISGSSGRSVMSVLAGEKKLL